MESNITEPQYSGGLLSEPHFDEEATLLSARPVVPLHEIKAAERSGRRLTFGLALAAALMIGALGATLIYRQRGQAPAASAIETGVSDANDTAAPAAPTATDAAGGTSDSPAPALSASATASDTSHLRAREPHDTAATSSRKPAKSVAQSAGSAKPAETWRDEVDDLEAKRAERRAERQEGRRLRQEAKREARGEVRGRRVQRSDDLLRIREIFEGAPRPRRFQRWQ